MLSKYHRTQAAMAKERLAKQMEFKEKELRIVFGRVRKIIPHPTSPLDYQGGGRKIFSPLVIKGGVRGGILSAKTVKIAVLGCAHKGLIKVHKEIFEKLLKKPVKLTTFDIVIEHLKGGKNVVKHDCTKPLPGGPYHIIYGHVVLKFIKTAKQWNFIKNSYDALSPGGLAIHIMNEEDYKSPSSSPFGKGGLRGILPDGYNSVPLAKWEKKLKDEKIKFKKIPFKIKKLRGLALVLMK